MTTDTRYWDRVADRYAARPIRDEAIWREKLAIIRGLLAPEASVLELGCGTGTTALALAPHAGAYLATDASARMIAIALAKAAATPVPGLRFERRALEESAGSAPVDMVIALSLLHLLDDRPAALRVIHGLLRPGGLFVSTTFALPDASLKVRALVPLLRAAGVIPRIRRVSGDALAAEMSAAGFGIAQRWSPGRDSTLFIVARKPDPGV